MSPVSRGFRHLRRASDEDAGRVPPGRYVKRRLVPDLRGPPAHLLADARPGCAEAQADRADIPALGLVPVDRVLTVPAALTCGLNHASRLRLWLPDTRPLLPDGP
jgi:hypothetical protein